MSKGEGSEEAGRDQGSRMGKLPGEGGGKSLGRIGEIEERKNWRD